MKKFILLSVFICTGFFAFAQQESQFTNFMHNYLQLNPAYAGAREVPSFTALYRSQWLGFEGAPVSQVVSFNSPFFGKRVGFGLNIHHRSAGITNQWSGSLAYSYDLRVSEDFGLRLGLQGAIKYLGLNFADEKVILTDQGDPSTAMNADMNQYYGNVGVGFFATYKDIYFGASVPGLLPVEIGFNPTSSVVAEAIPHAYGMLGATFRGSDKVRIRPAMLIKYVENAPIDLDVNLSFIFEKDASVGLSYRAGGNGVGESIDLLLFYQINPKLGAGLAYDFSISKLARYNTGSFEALVRYDLQQDREDLSNPRFF